MNILKGKEANELLEQCIGRHGVWAGNGRYAFQNWTRDLAYGSAPCLMELGRAWPVRQHLANLIRGQRENGQIPILFLDGLRGHARFVLDKAGKSLRNVELSFMLRRYLRGKLWNLTPGTRDSEIAYLVAIGEYGDSDTMSLDGHPHAIDRAFDYIERTLMVDGLVTGADWRDTMHLELADKPLLTNNCLLYRAYQLHGREREAAALRKRIQETHFDHLTGTHGRILDYPGNDRFDPLGGAFAVLTGVAEPSDYAWFTEKFQDVDRPFGVTIQCRHNPISKRERQVIEETNGVVTWPFVVGYAVLALLKMGERSLAEAQFAKLSRHEGFREYYHPDTGEGFGEQGQLWSAALYLRAERAIRKSREATPSLRLA